ncbi:MAG TPA: F0F1 ATP synthase subunit A [Terriglobia bacterium]|nr:F0F1 ATP synthase subunit A [Terriglobia bacterium]
MEHELWFTALLNKLFGNAVNVLLAKIAGVPGLEWLRPTDPGPPHPIPNYIAMEILVILVIVIAALVLKSRLSVEQPGKFQHLMEVVVEFVQSTADEIIGHNGRRYVPLLGTLFIYVAVCNIIGLIPTLQTPTAAIQATLGLAVAAFLYYNYHGFRQHGVFGYLKHLWGPMLLIGILMFPIEVFGNVFRLLSLSVRLYANMMVGDLLEQVFGGLVPVVVPVFFAALHIFVSLLQAYIFMLLPAIYLSLAVSEEH